MYSFIQKYRIGANEKKHNISTIIYYWRYTCYRIGTDLYGWLKESIKIHNIIELDAVKESYKTGRGKIMVLASIIVTSINDNITDGEFDDKKISNNMKYSQICKRGLSQHHIRRINCPINKGDYGRQLNRFPLSNKKYNKFRSGSINDMEVDKSKRPKNHNYQTCFLKRNYPWDITDINLIFVDESSPSSSHDEFSQLGTNGACGQSSGGRFHET
ncbi:hypothetical protein RF11_13380 [Thelohanellus kitauei]|uniref:Uncharacterized protein n=1 Tax=Thelohanellus kitauei TaxID=669202 RepID=A0A0C2I4Z6_THEKT|nr:hypothetical protein RF11_13380 [Thelohanellus kitauei]